MTTSSGVRSWWDSTATFKRCTTEKVAFIALAELDLLLTIFAVFVGFTELNPFVRFLFTVPPLMVMVKGILPVLIAWIIPGRLLWPSIAALGLVFLWNIKELIVSVFA